MNVSLMSGYRVLVVDSDRNSRAQACQFLSRMGAARISEAASGREAILLLEQEPHIVLTEVDTGAISGIQLLQHIRSQPGLKGITVVMLTSQGDGHVVNEALESGADGYIVKPVTEEALGARCAAAIRRGNIRKGRP